MVATRTAVDGGNLRRAAELAGDDEEHLPVQPPLVEVREGEVDPRDQAHMVWDRPKAGTAGKSAWDSVCGILTKKTARSLLVDKSFASDDILKIPVQGLAPDPRNIRYLWITKTFM